MPKRLTLFAGTSGSRQQEAAALLKQKLGKKATLAAAWARPVDLAQLHGFAEYEQSLSKFLNSKATELIWEQCPFDRQAYLCHTRNWSYDYDNAADLFTMLATSRDLAVDFVICSSVPVILPELASAKYQEQLRVERAEEEIAMSMSLSSILPSLPVLVPQCRVLGLAEWQAERLPGATL